MCEQRGETDSPNPKKKLDFVCVLVYWAAQLTFVGKIVVASEEETVLRFTIDDGTGRAPVSMWKDSDDPESLEKMKEQWTVGTYVRVYGHIRDPFNDNLQLTAFAIKPLTDFNEISYHAAQVIKVHLEHTKAAGLGGGSDTKAGAGAATGSGMMMGGGGMMGNFGGGFGGAGGGGGLATGQDPCQQAVEQFFMGPAAVRNENGCSIREAQQQLQSNFTGVQIQQAILALVEQGALYSTIDDEHYKSTSA